MYIKAYKDPNQSQLFRYYIHMEFFDKSDSWHQLSDITCYLKEHESNNEKIK